MRLGTLLTLGAIGGFAYVHKRRGGDFTLESIKETARALLDAVSPPPGTNSARMYEGDGAELRH